jgi:hypothetical protein
MSPIIVSSKQPPTTPSSSVHTMNSIRSIKSIQVAAFLFGGLLAQFNALPAGAAETFRLDRIAIVQFSPTVDDRLLVRNGVLDVAGQVAWRSTQTITRPANVPTWIFNRNLVNVNAWLAFRSLGGLATVDFELQEGSERVLVGDQAYMAIAPREGAVVATGKLINISTRTRLSGGDVVIAGFVIEDRPRAVLVRAVGPGLARFNVPSPHPDPWLAIRRNSQTIVGNDDWSNQGNAALVERVSARVGAFPLPTGSFDAAHVVILPPGVYSVHVGSDRFDVFSGDILIEVYSVPEDVLDSI